MSRDNLKIGFRVHTVWRVDGNQVPLFMERFSTTVDRDDDHQGSGRGREDRLRAFRARSRYGRSRSTRCNAATASK